MMTGEELRQLVREVVSSIDFSWQWISPWLVQKWHQLALDITPELKARGLTAPSDRTRRSHGQSLRPHDSPVNRNGGDHARL
jgi:hypothetical protein